MKEMLENLKWYLDNEITEIIHNECINSTKIKEEPKKIKNKTTLKEKNNISQNIRQQSITSQINSAHQLMTKDIFSKEKVEVDTNACFKTIDEYIKIAEEAATRSNTIEELREEVKKFDGCYSIKKLATNTVFSDGSTESGILIVGEAPGNNEDLQGIPFCGMSGELLNSMFKAIGCPREKIYITNTLFWRPPGNRTPTPEELAMCRPFVEKHIALVKPKLIIMMGSTALNGLLEVKETITRARRKFYDYTNKYLDKPIKATALFHPSYLLRQPLKKRDAWEDLLLLKKYLDSQREN